MLFYGVAVYTLPGEHGRKGIHGKYMITLSLPHCCLYLSLLIPEIPPRRPAPACFIIPHHYGIYP